MPRVGPNRLDPTLLAGLRRSFTAAIRRRAERLKVRVRHVVLTLDVFGLESTHDAFVGNVIVNESRRAWAYETSGRKLERFRAWLRQQMESDLRGDKLVEEFIGRAYRKGSDRSQGTESLRFPTVEKVNLLAARTFAELEDVDSRTATKMSRVLAVGLAQGRTPRQIAKDMTAEVDLELPRALTVVRTELTRAHAEGQLDALERLGEDGVTALVEFDATGNACPRCNKLDGKTFALDEARDLIPVHPNCRCAWRATSGTSKTRRAIKPPPRKPLRARRV